MIDRLDDFFFEVGQQCDQLFIIDSHLRLLTAKMPFSNPDPASRDVATAQRFRNWNRGKDFHRVVASSRETSP
jgi:hypothetical protein